MINYSNLAYGVEPMRPEDIPEVMAIEHVAFSAPWSARAYDYELHYNEMAHYFVVRPSDLMPAPANAAKSEDGANRARHSFWDLFVRQEKRPAQTNGRAPVVGYGGLWLMVDEAHISTIASHPDWRGRGIGELLLLAMIQNATEIGAHVVTLEVRVSNATAQALYRKYGFLIAGTRKGYYSDNGEDAYIMTTPPITTAEYTSKLETLSSALIKRLGKRI